MMSTTMMTIGMVTRTVRRHPIDVSTSPGRGTGWPQWGHALAAGLIFVPQLAHGVRLAIGGFRDAD